MSTSLFIKRNRDETGGYVLYDGSCSFCRGLAALWQRTLQRRGFLTTSLQDASAEGLIRLADDELLKDIRVLTSSGRLISGSDAYLYVMDAIWWARPLAFVLRLPVIRTFFRWGYRRFADNRYCVADACRIGPVEPRTLL